MDRQLEQKRGISKFFSRKYLPYWCGAVFIVVVIVMFSSLGGSKLRVSKGSFVEAEVQEGVFDDYIRVSGQVQPMTTVQLSPSEGGSVVSIEVEEGESVQKGDVILVLGNESLDMQILNSEAELAEKENILRNTMISMEQQKLSVRQERLQLQIDVRRARRAYEQNKVLYDERLIARETYIRAQEDYMLAKDKLELVENREKQDSLYRSVEIGQMRESLENMRLNMGMIRHRRENLSLRAPISGEIGLLDVELGQSVASGAKIGQINDLSSYKVEAQLDEHYIDRVAAGLEATLERQGQVFSMIVRKVYPEVREGKFKADFRFTGSVPDNIRTGQAYNLNLQLGQNTQGAIIIPRGAFFQSTGGKWIYVLDSSGARAVRREIRLGRQNPQYYEVIEGLRRGERVIISSYESFGDKEQLIIR